MKPELELFVGCMMVGGTLSFIVFMALKSSVNHECEKELISRNEPRGIVCLTKIQSIVTSNGDEQ